MVRNIIIAIIAIVVLYFILVWLGVIGGADNTPPPAPAPAPATTEPAPAAPTPAPAN